MGDGTPPPEALLAGGLFLGKTGWLGEDVPDAELRSELTEILQSNAVWVEATAPQPEEPPRYLKPLPRWMSPPAMSVELGQRLTAAWQASVPDRTSEQNRYVRVTTDEIAAYRTVQAIGWVGDLQVCPSMSTKGNALTWHWPLRVGILGGPRSDRWLEHLSRSPNHGNVYEAKLVGWGDRPETDAYEILIVDVSRLRDVRRGDLDRSSSVIATGASHTADMFAELRRHTDSPVAAAIPGDPPEWWSEFYHALAHNLPIDVAVRRAHPDALVTMPVVGSEITAVADWYLAANFDDLALLADIDRVGVPGVDWTREDGKATLVSDRSKNETTGPGTEPTASVDAQPPRVELPPPDRRLVAEFLHDDEKVRKVLPPETDLQLEIRIAIPEEGETYADESFPAPQTQQNSARLVVRVQSDVWHDHDTKTHDIQLPMASNQLDQPSGLALFDFTTPASGKTVAFDIKVFYDGNLIHEATLTATVRHTSTPRDKHQLLTHALTGPNHPAPETRPADRTFDASDGMGLRDMFTDRLVAQVNAENRLGAYEDIISKVLGRSDAPTDLNEDRARELLITLARRGTAFRTQLDDLDLKDAATIKLLVSKTTTVLPLELVYDGEPPGENAQLCRHVTDPPPPGEACTKTSKRVVCPYAFWGLTRTISRTVRSPGEPKPNPMRLDPRTVLYGASVIADHGALEPVPSDRLERAATDLFGRVSRTKSWRDWRRKINSERPEVLLVLGHTDTEQGEPGLHIGKRSVLRRDDVKMDCVRHEDGPSPLVLLIACATLDAGDPFGNFPVMFTAAKAGAVVGTIARINGPQGATSAEVLLQSLQRARAGGGRLSDVLSETRRTLISQGLLAGLILVSHGEIDLVMTS